MNRLGCYGNQLQGLSGLSDAAQAAGGNTSSGVWDFFGKSIDAAKQAYGWTLQSKQGQPVAANAPAPTPTVTSQGTDWGTIIMYGALAAGAVGLTVYLLKKKKRK